MKTTFNNPLSYIYKKTKDVLFLLGSSFFYWASYLHWWLISIEGTLEQHMNFFDSFMITPT